MDLTLTPTSSSSSACATASRCANADGDAGSAAPRASRVHWTGVLLVEQDGDVRVPRRRAHAARARSRTSRRRGPALAGHAAPRASAPGSCSATTGRTRTAPPTASAPLALRRGAYEIDRRARPTRSRPSHATGGRLPGHTGFQLKYSGPDTGGRLVAMPHDRLFRDAKDDTLGAWHRAALAGAARRSCNDRYTSTLRDIRRTYQRAFKALLFAHRFALSAQPVADDRQSELGYLLGHAGEVRRARSYYRAGRRLRHAHRAYFDFNLLPACATTTSPRPAAQDQRVAAVAAARGRRCSTGGSGSSTTRVAATRGATGARAPAVAAVRRGRREAARRPGLSAAPPRRRPAPRAAGTALLRRARSTP